MLCECNQSLIKKNLQEPQRGIVYILPKLFVDIKIFEYLGFGFLISIVVKLQSSCVDDWLLCNIIIGWFHIKIVFLEH